MNPAPERGGCGGMGWEISRADFSFK